MPTLHTTTYTSVFSGQNVGPAFPQYNTFTISGNIELSWPMGFQNLNPVVAVNMDISATAGGFTVKMPDAEGAGTGYAIKINNPGNFSFNLIDNSSNLIVTIPNGTTKEIWLIDNGTVAGTWRTFPNPGGGSAVTSINATSSSNNLVVTGAPGLPITSAGTIQFALANDLLALSTFGASTGIAVRTAANTWALRSINGTVGQILVTNPSGVAGDVTIALSNVLTNLVSIGVGNLSLSGNTIASTNANGNIIINPQGTGRVQLAKNTELLTGSSLKYFDVTGNFYTSFKNGTTAINQDLIWPTTAPLNGQVLSHSAAGQLQWASVATTGGGMTIVNSLARYSNTGGGLTDSTVILDNAQNMTGINSAQIKNILIGIAGDATISTQLTNQDLTFSPNGLGFCISKTDFLIRRNVAAQSRLRLYNDADNFYAGLIAHPNMVADFTWRLPLAGNIDGFFHTDTANQITITPITSFFPAISTLNAVPRFSNTTGSPLKNSLFVIDDAGIGTGLTQFTIGNISINTTVNTISSTANLDMSTLANMSVGAVGNISMGAAGVNSITFLTDLNFKNAGTGIKANFYNPAGTFATSIVNAATASSFTLTLPIALTATTGIMNVGSTGAMSISALGAAAGSLRTDGAGNITINSITTAANQVAKYSDTVGTTAPSTMYLDANSNLSISDTTIPGGGATNAVTLNVGTSATSIAASHLTLQARDTGTGIVPGWYGAGNGGVSASVLFTVTNKISIYVNGTRYYLLANTSGA